MQGYKLISFGMKNFGPFAEEFKFTTSVDCAKKDGLEENTYVDENNRRYNKVSYVYGANGAGKSNFCKAILQFQRFLMLSPLLASNNPQLFELTSMKNQTFNLNNPFLFDKDYINKETCFSIEILVKNTLYNYSFSTLDGKILSEKLCKKNKRNEVILERTSPHNNSIMLKSELKDFEQHISVVKENVLCLSMAAFLNIKLADEIMNAIQSIKVINMAMVNNFHGDEENCTPEKMAKYLKILKIADPTLKSVKVLFDEKQEETKKIDVADIEGKELVFKKVKVDITSTHTIYNNGVIEESEALPFLEIESMGTIKLFSILPVIFEKLSSGCTLVIDEIDNGLHPKLIKNIIKLFYDSNPYSAELIVTTHSKELIEKDIRRDQVWIISKDEKGISSIKRVSDIPGIRAYEEKGAKYLKDAFDDDKFILNIHN